MTQFVFEFILVGLVVCNTQEMGKEIRDLL